MKNLKLIVILFSLVFTNLCYSQSGWVKLNPNPTGSNLYSVDFIDTLTGYACGNEGTIIRTTNGGLNWSEQYSGAPTDIILYNIKFINNETGFAAGGSSFPARFAILKTTNSGTNWNISFINSQGAYFLKSIYFVNQQTGYIVGNYHAILKTTNTGNNWFSITNNLDYDFEAVYFINATTGFIGGDWSNPGSFSVFKTTNEGNNWLQQTFSTGSITSICFSSMNTGYVSSLSTPNSNFFKTSNSGNNWFTVTTSLSSLKIDFPSDSLGFSCGWAGVIGRTSNGGLNWITDSIALHDLYSVKFLSNQIGFTVGGAGTIIKTSNYGVNWINQTSQIGEDLSAASFINENTGYLAGTTSLHNKRIIRKTIDGGYTWEKIYYINSIQWISDIYFANSNSGYFLNRSNKIYKTTNGGNNWDEISINGSFEISYCSFIDSNIGYIGDTHGKVYKTTNGGLNWINQISGLANIQSISFLNNNYGIVANGPDVSITTNGGLNWFVVNVPAPYPIYSVDYIAQDIAYISTYGGNIYKTTNSGFNWARQLYNSTLKLFSINFLNSQTGYSVGSYGTIFKTTDGGQNWITQNSLVNKDLYKIKVLNDTIGYILGAKGIILKTVTGGNVVGINQFTENSPVFNILSQNYPNPFNPQTKIKFDIPVKVKGQTSNVRLVIYDLLGREVTTLVNEELKPGTYEADWDGTNFSSGVYFYKIISGDFTVTKKMVLMK